jgi:catechol 2,3-dioxygenase-like lactoylglutathione lyase family enzyme
MKNTRIALNHVAILVRSLSRAVDFFAGRGFEPGEVQEWEAEGTREMYIGRNKPNALLLLEAAKPGPYRRALEKRGPGLHHLAVDVSGPALEAYLESLKGTAWRVHPYSAGIIEDLRTAYLSAPGFPGLIEVQEKEETGERDSAPLFVESVSLAIADTQISLLKSVGLESVVKPVMKSPSLHIAGEEIILAEFCE